MNPPYTITSSILALVAEIFGKVGKIDATYLDKPSPQLRKQNRVKTINASLAIEGNTLTGEQVTAILEGKRVFGPKKDILEVENALKVYADLRSCEHDSGSSFLSAHNQLMQGLMDVPGRYRTVAVGIYQGSKLSHMPPPPRLVPQLMDALFEYAADVDELALIKSCVFHYELEFIHPFEDGNGRMGRLWQALILAKWHPIFEFVPFETLIKEDQKAYYDVLAVCDKAGNSTAFIEFMLRIINESLGHLIEEREQKMTGAQRLAYFLEDRNEPFRRADYKAVFPDVSTATASRDLADGVKAGIIEKEGDKRTTVYRIIDLETED